MEYIYIMTISFIKMIIVSLFLLNGICIDMCIWKCVSFLIVLKSHLDTDKYICTHSEKSPARPMLFYSTNYWHYFNSHSIYCTSCTHFMIVNMTIFQLQCFVLLNNHQYNCNKKPHTFYKQWTEIYDCIDLAHLQLTSQVWFTLV